MLLLPSSHTPVVGNAQKTTGHPLPAMRTNTMATFEHGALDHDHVDYDHQQVAFGCPGCPTARSRQLTLESSRGQNFRKVTHKLQRARFRPTASRPVIRPRHEKLQSTVYWACHHYTSYLVSKKARPKAERSESAP